MGRNTIVAGTGFNNDDGSCRRTIIERYCRKGLQVMLRREPGNPYDPDAVAVYLPIPKLFGFLGADYKQIGYVKAKAAEGLAKRIDAGEQINGYIESYYAPEGIENPRVSLHLEY